MKLVQFARHLAALLLMAAATAAHAQSCTATGSSVNVTVTDIFAGDTDAQASITFNCTRTNKQATFPSVFWVGVSGTNGSRTMTNGANSLGYYLFTAYPACATAWQGTTGVTINNTLTAAGDTNINITATFCMRIYAGQTTAKPLSYTGSALTVTVRSTSSSGFTWLTTSGAGTATVNPRCYFSTGPSTVTVNYTSFQGTAATGTGSFQMRCTNTTPYSLALDAVSGTALGLNYAVGLGTVGTSSVPSQAGTGMAQSYSVAASIAAGQSGTCAVTAGCSATDTRIVTVTY